MKIKNFILLTCIIGSFCVVSCELTDETDDETQNETPEETEPQPVYELSLHQLSLRIQIDSLQTRLENLVEGTDEHASTQDQLNFSEEFLVHVETKLLGIDPPPPIPGPDGPIPLPGPIPCPPEGNCGIPIRDIPAIFVPESADFNLAIYNHADGLLVGGIEVVETVEFQNKTYLKYTLNITNGDILQDIYLDISKESDFMDGMMVNYQIDVELPAG